MLVQIFKIFVCLLLLPSNIIGEFYSSVGSLHELVDVEKEWVGATRLLLDEQQQQLDMYRNFVAGIKRDHEIAKQQQLDYFEQPMQVFRLTKRLVEDWPNLHEQLETQETIETYQQSLNVVSQELGMPNLTDLQGAVKGLVCLQNVYNLTAYEFAEGYLNNVFTGTVLSWHECFEMGVQLYELSEYKSALEWLLVAVNLLNENEFSESDHALKMLSEVFEYLALTYIELGEKERSLELINELVSWDPTHPAQHTLNYLAQRMPKCPKLPIPDPEFDDYTRLCQGKRLPEFKSSIQKLSCFLDFKRHGIFQLAPLKVEQAHLNPDIHIYHELLSDTQIADILAVADEFQMVRSTVANGKLVDGRVSQQVWLKYTEPILQSWSRLVGAISGYDMINAEQVQIANYGIGGQYMTHYDYINELPKDFITRGNRIATTMFYLSDVLQGGYTVFPNLNVFLKPIKGSMVMWHNVNRSLQRDDRTMHAGCPVLEGSKYIGNIWIHAAHQEFKRPCSLDPNE